MDISDWINLIAAIIVGGGTLFLGIMAWRTIHQTRSIQRAEKRERLLNEIIEWAKKVYSMPWKFGSIFKEAVKITNENDAYLFKIAHIEEIKESFIEFHGNNLYAKEISLCFTDLHNASLKLISEYEKYTALLEQYGTVVRKVKKNEATQVDEQEAESKVDASSRQINNYAYKVIKEATKIKTRDIGKKEQNMSKESEVTGSNEPTVKDIEEHLKQQDRLMKKGNYLTGAAFGAAIGLIGISFMVQMKFQLSPYTYIVFFLVMGLGFMFLCWWKQSRVK